MSTAEDTSIRAAAEAKWLGAVRHARYNRPPNRTRSRLLLAADGAAGRRRTRYELTE